MLTLLFGWLSAWLLPLATLAGPPEPFLVVLGVAQDAGFPQAGCQKECCRLAWLEPQRRQWVSCLAVVDPASGRAWVLDATPSYSDQAHYLETVVGAKVAGIFLTHAHIGHYTGLMQLGREVQGTKALPVFAMPRMATFLQENGPWSQLVSLENIRLQRLTADSTIQLTPNLAITPLRVPHRDEYSETVGFRITGPSRQALFIPDIDKWERWDRSIEQEVEATDWAFLDGTFFAEGEIPGRNMAEIPHPFIQESITRLAGLPSTVRSKIHFIHFNHTNPVLQPGHPALRQISENGFQLARQFQRFPL